VLTAASIFLVRMPALPRMLKLSTAAEWAVRVCAVVLGALFLLSGLVYLYLGRWTVTLQDYWRIYDLCFKHTWLESALLKYNSHSLFFLALSGWRIFAFFGRSAVALLCRPYSAFHHRLSAFGTSLA